MAKSNVTVLETDTLATVFADLHDKVIIWSGPQNDKPNKGDNGFLVPILLPRRYINDADEAATFVASNWFSERDNKGAFGKVANVAEKVAHIESYLETTWEPSEARLKSPVEMAIFEKLVAKFPENIVGKSAVQVDRDFQPAVAANLNNPARTESGIPLVDAYLPRMRAMVKPRARKGQEAETETVDASMDNLSID